MTERDRRRQAAVLSVVAVSAIGLVASCLAVVHHDQGTTARSATAGSAEANPSPGVRIGSVSPELRSVDLAGAPAPGLRPAALPRRRVVVVRRSRAS